MKLSTVARISACVTTLAASTTAFAGSSPVGVWLDDSGRGAVEIAECGKALCGKLVWIKEAVHGKACGMDIIGEAAASGQTWSGGWIYSPEKKKRYNVELTPLADGKLRVVGYAGMRFLSKTMIWTKAPADLARCDKAEVATTVTATSEKPSIETKPVSPPSSSATVPSNAGATPSKTTATSKPVGEVAVAQADSAEAEEADGLASVLNEDLNIGEIFSRKNGKCSVSFGSFNMNFDCDKKP